MIELEKQPPFMPFKGPLLVITHYRLPVPKSGSFAWRNRQDGFPHIVRPDGDNLEKFLNDSLTGVLWTDDSIIAWLLRSKSLTIGPGSMTVFVRELEFAKPNYELILEDIAKNINLENEDEVA